MATTIVTKNGSGAPAVGDLVQGELAVDLTNQTLYSKDSSGNVFKVGDTGGGSPGTFTDLVATDSFTSPGIDDNATSTAITIDASQKVGIGTNPSEALDVVGSIKGSKNLLLDDGSLSGFVQVSSNALQVGASTSGSVIDFYTENSQKMRIDSTGNVGIGETSPTSALTVKGDIELTGGPKTIKNGSGFLQVGTTSADDLTFLTNSTERLRIDAAGTTTVTGGFKAAQPGAGVNATAIGDNAGLTSQSTGAVGIGAAAGQISQGSYGVAIGNAAGYTGQGDSSTAVGRDSGKTNQGTTAVAVGYRAGQTSQGADAVAVGNGAGSGTQSESSVAVGILAGTSTQGSRAVAIGRGAGQVNQGDYSVALGFAAGATNQGANGIIINSSGSTVNSTDAGHIVIRSSQGYLALNPAADTWTFNGGDVTVPNDNLLVGTTSNPSAGKVAIDYARGTSAGMRIKDTAGAGGTGVIADFYNSSNVSVGSITHDSSTASYNPSSDARLKENIRDYDNALGAVMKLRPRKYSWKVNGAEDNGFIAQELLETPEFANRVNPISDGDDPLYGVDYMKFVAVLTGAIQEQQAMIETLQAEVAALKGA